LNLSSDDERSDRTDERAGHLRKRALAASEIPDDVAEKLRQTEMDRRHAHLDRLMDE
jgi:hypothetical protein